MKLIWSFCIVAMISSFTFVEFISLEGKDFLMDDIGNLYMIQGATIEKFNPTQKTSFRTSELQYGNIDLLDLTNPLKPFLYFKDLNKVVVLDNTLSQQGDVIDLFNVGYDQVECIAGSRGDAFWLWDSRNSELIRVDQSFKKLHGTGNLSVLLGKAIKPAQILERGQFLLLRDPDQGIFVFDIYGNYKTTLLILLKSDIQFIQNTLVYHQGQQLHLLSSDWITEEILELPKAVEGRVQFFNSQIYLKVPNGVEVWKKMDSTRN